MIKLEATFRIVTPMFLGGADRQAEAIRPASVKGALRFWWRAINWARCLAESEYKELDALKRLHDEEAKLFGAAAENDNGGQGIFLLQICRQKIKTVEQPFSPMANGLLYLLGMGLATFKNGGTCLRNAIQANGEFVVKLVFRPKVAAADMKQISDALLLFGLLGALGSRARHGLGSVAITQWNGPQRIATTTAEYKVLLQSLVGGTNASAQPPFTAFSESGRVDFSQTHANAIELLNAIGQEQQIYRSYGRGGLVNGQPKEHTFDDDHDLILSTIDRKCIVQAPQRAVFGLPHNYFFSSVRQNVEVNYMSSEGEGRRASPLMLHIHPVGEEFIAVHTLLPAQFLPDSAKIRIKTGGFSTEVASSPNWQILHNYLNRYKKRDSIHGGK